MVGDVAGETANELTLLNLEEIVEEVRRHPRLVIADDYELTLQRVSQGTHKYYNGDSASHSFEEGVWISLRIIHRKRPGRAITFQPTKTALRRLVENAFDSANASSSDPWFRFPIWKQPKALSTAEVMESENKSAVLAEEKSLFSSFDWTPSVLEEAYQSWNVSTRLVRKQERFQLSHRKQMHALHFSTLNHSESGYLWLKEDRGACHSLTQRQNWLRSLLQQSQALAKGKVFSEKGSAHLLVAPALVTSFLKRIAQWFYADWVQFGRSPLGLAREGSKDVPLLSPAITILDHGNYGGGMYSAPFDMEGSLTQCTTIVDKGVLRDFLYDTYFATRENRLSTGNFVRNPQAIQPRVAATNLYVTPSTSPVDVLLKDMGEGYTLDVLDSMERHSSSDFEFVIKGSGWKVREGHRVEPVREITLKVGILELFKRARVVGNDLEFYGPFGAPSILFENMPLGEER